jgi:hypothetical protein
MKLIVAVAATDIVSSLTVTTRSGSDGPRLRREVQLRERGPKAVVNR